MFSFKKLFTCNYYKDHKKIEKKRIQKSFIFAPDNNSPTTTDLDSSCKRYIHNFSNNHDNTFYNQFNNLSPTIKEHVILGYGNVDILYSELYKELNSVRCQNLNHEFLVPIIKKVINNQLVLDYLYYKDKIFNKYYNIYFIKNKNFNYVNLFDNLCEKLCIDWINELHNQNINFYHNNNINTNIDDSYDNNSVGLDISI